jgi:hypothetical protein
MAVERLPQVSTRGYEVLNRFEQNLAYRCLTRTVYQANPVDGTEVETALVRRDGNG